MIESEVVHIVNSNVIGKQIFSEDVPDYRELEYALRITQDGIPRETQDNNLRILEP